MFGLACVPAHAAFTERVSVGTDGTGRGVIDTTIAGGAGWVTNGTDTLARYTNSLAPLRIRPARPRTVSVRDRPASDSRPDAQ